MIQVIEGALMRIGEPASRVGVSVRALRYYEEQDLLASVRSPSAASGSTRTARSTPSS